MVLLVEDNDSIAKGIEYAFLESGIRLFRVSSIEETINFKDINKIKLIILDILLPDGDGFMLYNNYIKDKKIPVIVLTALDREDMIVSGLEMGVEEYLTKPFKMKELIVRVKRILDKNKKIVVKDIVLDVDKMLVYKNYQVINLTCLEIKILHLLMMNRNLVVTRDKIINYIWDLTGNDVYENSVTVYIKRIREKLQSDIVRTVKGVGYIIDD